MATQTPDKPATPSQVGGLSVSGLPPLPTIAPVQQSLPLLAPLPTIPDRLTEWFPMRKAPWEPGEYEVRHDPVRGCTTDKITRETWDGFNWTTLRGKFTANGWRGLAQQPNKE